LLAAAPRLRYGEQVTAPPTSFDSVVLAAVAPDLEEFIGGRIGRISQPSAVEVAGELRRGPRRATLLCSIDARWARVHLAAPVGPGELSGFGLLLRARLEDAQLTEIHQPPFDRILMLVFTAMTGRVTLAVEIMGRHSNLILVHDGLVAGSLKLVPRTKSAVREILPGRPYTPPPRDRPTPADLTQEALSAVLAYSDPLGRRLSGGLLGVSPIMATELATRAGLDPRAPANTTVDAGTRLWPHIQELCRRVRDRDFAPTVYADVTGPIGYSAFPFVHLGTFQASSVPCMSEAVERVVGRRTAQTRIEEDRAPLAQVVQTARTRTDKTISELRRALAEAEQTTSMRERGELLLAYAARVPTGAREVTLPGYDEAPVLIPLDPALSAVKNAQHLFKRAAKIRGARTTVLQRLRAAEAEAEYLDAVGVHIDQALTPDDLFDLHRELAEGRYLRARRTPKRPSSVAHPRIFRLRRGGTLLVGRSNLENDALTFKVADPDDLWFHARGVSGAHVVLRVEGRAPTEDMVRHAAAAAAYFSRARGSGQVAVDYTQRRNVRKPRGAKPGVVVYTREHTVHVGPAEPDTLDKVEARDE